MSGMIKLLNVNKSFGKLHVLKDLNFTVNKSEVVSIIGPSGGGKSTILRCINYLEPIDSGEIYIEDKLFDPKHSNIYKHRQQLGFVFQSFNLFPHLSVIENVTLAPRMLFKIPPKIAEDKAENLLASVGLAEKKLAYPNELSGGQRQRVS